MISPQLEVRCSVIPHEQQCIRSSSFTLLVHTLIRIVKSRLDGITGLWAWTTGVSRQTRDQVLTKMVFSTCFSNAVILLQVFSALPNSRYDINDCREKFWKRLHHSQDGHSEQRLLNIGRFQSWGMFLYHPSRTWNHWPHPFFALASPQIGGRTAIY